MKIKHTMFNVISVRLLALFNIKRELSTSCKLSINTIYDIIVFTILSAPCFPIAHVVRSAAMK